MTDSFPNTKFVTRSQSDAGSIIRAKSPLRISFAGGGTDIREWYEKRTGAVLSSTIDHCAHVTLYPREDKTVHIRSVELGYMTKYDLDTGPVYDGVNDLAMATIDRLGLDHGADIDIRTDAPAGSGLGGSSALTAAVIGALAEYKREPPSPYECAELNYLIEREDLAISGGKQDQFATTFGGFNYIEFRADDVLVTPLRINQNVLNDLEAHLLLCYTGSVRPDLKLIDRQMSYFKEGRPETVTALERLYNQVFTMKESLLKGDLDAFGQELDRAYRYKKEMNPHVAEGTPADLLYEKALGCGALGGKLLGAGGGGYLAIYCPTHQQHAVRNALEALGGQFTDFSFDTDGLQVWRSRNP